MAIPEPVVRHLAELIPFPNPKAELTHADRPVMAQAYLLLREQENRLKLSKEFVAEWLRQDIDENGAFIHGGKKFRLTTRQTRTFDPIAVLGAIGLAAFKKVVKVSATAMDAAMKLGLFDESQLAGTFNIEVVPVLDVR